MSAQSLSGEYNLHVREMASGFRFSEDGKFDFYYSYGAVDRAASGTYTMEGDTVKLKSDKEPGKDFPIQAQSRKGKGYTIQVKDANQYLLKYVRCMYFIGDEQHEAMSDDDGKIHLDVPHCDKIYLQHQLFPDVGSLIKDTDNDNNYFEVSLSPSLAFVSFKGIDLFRKGDELTCLPNYFMPMEDIRYIKE